MAEKELKIKITVDGKDAEYSIKQFAKSIEDANKQLEQSGGGFSSFQSQLITLNQGLELGRKGLDLAREAIKGVVESAERGNNFQNLTQAFNNLYGATQTLGNDGLGKLRKALKGTVDDFELLKISNQAAQRNLDPEVFLKLAEAADDLGQSVGKNAKEAFEDLAEGFALGKEKQLAFYLGTIDNTKANEDFARKLGLSGDALKNAGSLLSENQKILALQAVALEKVGEKAAKAGPEHDTLSKAIEQLAAEYSNLKTALDVTINKSETFIGVVKDATLVVSALTGAVNLFSTDPLKRMNAELKDAEQTLKDVAALHADNGIVGFLSSFTQLDRREAGAKQTIATNLAKTSTIEFAKDDEKDLQQFAQLIERIKNNQQEFAAFQQRTADSAKQASAELAKTISEQDKSLSGLEGGNKFKELERQYSNFIKNTDFNAADHLIDSLVQAFQDNRVNELAHQYADLIASDKTGEQTKRVLTQALTDTNEFRLRLEDEFSDKQTDDIKKHADEQKAAFQKSVDFFSDILTATFEGDAKSIEGILKDALRRVAIGFGSQILASLTDGFGANIGSAGGLGQVLASALGLTGGAGGGLNSLFGGAASGGVGGAIASGGVGALTTSLGAFGNAAIGGSFGPVASGATYGSSLAGANVAAFATNPYTIAAIAAIAGGSYINNNFLKGTTSPEQLDRRNLVDQILGSDNRNVNTIRGSFNVDDTRTTVDQSNPISKFASNLLNPLGNVLTGGDDKLTDDFAAIFSDATDNATNFNEVLINTQSLFEQMGKSVPEVKDELTGLFLDGKVSLDEFSAGISNLNIIAQEDLIGPNSVSDALRVVADDTTSNRAKLHAFGLAFNELSQLGISNIGDIHAYLTDKFGPDVAEVFDELQQNGINSFEDIKNATADQIVQIFNILNPLQQAFSDAFGIDHAADGVEQAGKKMIRVANGVRDAWQEASGAMGENEAGSDSGDGGGQIDIGGDGRVSGPNGITFKPKAHRNGAGVNTNARKWIYAS